MCRRKCNPQKILILHRTPNNAQNSQKKIRGCVVVPRTQKGCLIKCFFFSLRSRNRRVYFASCVVRVISQENVKPSNKRFIIPLQKKILLFSHYLSISTWRVRIFRIPSVLKRSNRTLQGITAVLRVSYFERTLYPVGK